MWENLVCHINISEFSVGLFKVRNMVLSRLKFLLVYHDPDPNWVYMHLGLSYHKLETFLIICT